MVSSIKQDMLTNIFDVLVSSAAQMLEAKLQDGNKIPKWSQCYCLSMFLGISELRSSLVPLVLNIRT